MTICIDAFNLAKPHGTGVATYGRNLAKAAHRLGHEVGLLFGTQAGKTGDPLLDEIALAETEPDASKPHTLSALLKLGLSAAKRAVRGVDCQQVAISGQVIFSERIPSDIKYFWNVQNLYQCAAIAFRATGRFTSVSNPQIDLIHWTYPLPLRVQKAQNIYTLHDLVPLKLPYATADHKRSYLQLCKQIAGESDQILTVSECSRRDIIEILGISEDRVTNIYQSSDISKFVSDKDDNEISNYVENFLGFGFSEYFLFFGAVEPKKNLARLLEAYLSCPTKTPLVIVGAPGWGSQRDVELLKSLVALDTKKRILWLGYVPREMLAVLIAGARATLFPSLYEGFGLPVLESLSLGTPVVTSNTSSLPEIAGDAGLLVDPYDVRQIAAAIRTIDHDADLRAGLATRGRAQAAKFSDEAYQQRLSAFYQRLGF